MLATLMKSIDHIDDHCTAILDLSSAVVVGYTDVRGRPRAQLVAVPPDFAALASRPDLLVLPALEDPAPSTPVSTLFFVPGWRETLRVNGRLGDDTKSSMFVEEAFVHCAKAIIRSKLWRAPEQHPDPTSQPNTVDSFLARSPFVVISTQDAMNGADTSPKGDPPGFIKQLDETTIAIPDRPGNKRTDTFHNLLEHNELALVALIPGDDRVLEINGHGHVTADIDLLRTMTHQNKTPKAALVINITQATLNTNPELVASDLWNPARHPDSSHLPSAARIWSDHVRANRTTGVKAAAIRAGAGERLVRAGTASDYKRNLY
ncbi:MAG: pyridoxamine 5'-phosphate oxidase family protein [Acidimicrobiia bacterium]